MANESGIELVSGVEVEQTVRPHTTSAISDLLRTAAAAGETVVPFGGRRSLSTGNGRTSATYGLDLGAMSGVLEYAPADLTVSVRTGTTWGEIQRVLGEQGQELPVDIPEPEVTTVGGVVATGFAGARRHRSGTLKDLLIGCEFVRGDGLIARAGGMVVKNVSGFEIPRFLHGSWGSLAVLTSVNLKVLPKPRADGTLIARGYAIREALDLARELIGADSSLEAVAVEVRDGAATLAVRAVGRSTAVSSTLESASAATGSAIESIRFDDSESTSFWQSLVDRYSEHPDRLIVAVSTRPQDVPGVVDRLVAAVPDATMVAMPGYGSIRLSVEAVGQRDAHAWLQAISTAVNEAGAGHVIESAPPHTRDAFPAWGNPPDGIEVMRAVKAQFDPAGVLNPGRLVV